LQNWIRTVSGGSSVIEAAHVKLEVFALKFVAGYKAAITRGDSVKRIE
jgi:hypothetical protein